MKNKKNRYIIILIYKYGRCVFTNTVTFHAGALFTEPNTEDFIKTALKASAEIIEIDVSFAPDGLPVMIHKEEPQPGEGVPLSKAFELAKEHTAVLFNLDIKSLKNLEGLRELVEAFGLKERAFLTGVTKEWVPAVKNTGLSYYLNYSVSEEERNNANEARKAALLCKSLGAVGINADYRQVSGIFCTAVREEGLSVSLWTVDDPCDMKKALILGDNITTNRPDELYKIIKI